LVESENISYIFFKNQEKLQIGKSESDPLNRPVNIIGHIASEEVILQLVSTICIPILLYGLEVLRIRQSQLRLLDFMINRLFVKLFKTNDIRLVHFTYAKTCFIFIC